MEKLFDIIVPTYNRYHHLPEFFRNNAPLQFAPVMIWIIDDCSPEVDPSVIPSWNNLTFIRLTENKGQAHARNVAIGRGKSPFVISLDDDAWFTNPAEEIEKLIFLFTQYPDAGCMMFNIATPDTGYSKEPTGKILPLHITCGCAYRRNVLEGIGGFSGFLHSQAEESDVSIRIYQQGFKIRFAGDINVFHNFEPGKRSLRWYLYVRHNTTRNDLLIVLMRYPIAYIAPFIIGKYMRHLYFAYKNNLSVLKTISVTILAFFSFLILSPKAIRDRKPLTIQQFKSWRSILVNSYSH